MDKNKFFAAAEKAAARNQYDKAVESLEILLRSDPNDLKALNRVADFYPKAGLPLKAFDALKRVGSIYSRDGFYSKAVAIYKRMLKLEPVPEKPVLMQIHEQLATLYGQLGLVSDAMGHFSLVVDYYDEIGDQAALLEVLKKVSELDPQNIESQLKLVELMLAQAQEAEALEHLAQLEELTQARQNIPDLIRICERAVELFPKDVSRLHKLVDVFSRANDPKKALARLQAAFRLEPRNPEILELLSSTFRTMTQFEKARAVDFELVKLYREKGETEKVEVLERRLKEKSKAGPFTEADSSTPDAALPEEPQDPVESLIRALPLSPDEKKILAECEVYVKYGLVEKAYEVLKSKLHQFPQSLVLRWRLKSSAQELKRREETVYLLSELMLLAKSQNQEIWANLAASELKELDPAHPALAGTAQAPVSPQAAPPSARTTMDALKEVRQDRTVELEKPLELDFETGEVSIIIDEDMALENGDVPGISAADLSDQEETGKAVRAKQEEAIEILDDTPELQSQPEFQLPTEISEEAAPAVEATRGLSSQEDFASAPIELPGEDSVEAILSETDFSGDELAQLNEQLNMESVSQEKPGFQTETEPVETPEAENVELFELTSSDEDKHDVVVDDEFEIRQSLEEVIFFRSQGLEKEAESLLQSLKKKYPNRTDWTLPESASSESSSLVNAPDLDQERSLSTKSVSLETLGRKVKVQVQDDQRPEDSLDFFDLSKELNEELAESGGLNQGTAEVRDVFNAFKQGVAETVSRDDWQTHFDLGVAYREMGLYDDALEEFKMVSQQPEQKVAALYQMGLLKMQLEQYTEAKEYFTQALKEPKLLSQQRLSVSYDLAEVLLKLNDQVQARSILEEVKKIDPDFREVSEKIKAIV